MLSFIPNAPHFFARLQVSSPCAAPSPNKQELDSIKLPGSSKDQPGLPFGWPLERETPSLAHGLHRLLDAE
jgi:hypothetical protein